MSVTKEQLDKDVIFIASASELSTPSKVVLPEPEPSPGLILPDGSINWGCPCLGGMATGPCGPQFREAFTCFHYSEADPKGSECYEKFSVMQECMGQYPELYGRDNDDETQSLMDQQNEDSLAEAQKEIAPKPGPAGDPA